MGETHKMIHTYEAVASAVPEARRALVAFATAAGATPAEADDIRLATSEALTNVVVHAYGDRRGLIHVSAAMAGNELWILVGDDGGGLHAGTSRGGLGVGLALIAELTDGFAIVNRSTGGTELRMRFSLARVRQRAEDSQSACSSIASAARPARSVFSITR